MKTDGCQKHANNYRLRERIMVPYWLAALPAGQPEVEPSPPPANSQRGAIFSFWPVSLRKTTCSAGLDTLRATPRSTDETLGGSEKPIGRHPKEIIRELRWRKDTKRKCRKRRKNRRMPVKEMAKQQQKKKCAEVGSEKEKQKWAKRGEMLRVGKELEIRDERKDKNAFKFKVGRRRRNKDEEVRGKGGGG